MFRIRKVMDDIVPINREAIRQAQEILRTQFTLLSAKDIEKLPDQIRDPLKYKFRAILFVAENHKGALGGFALLLHAPDLKFCFLDYISTTTHTMGRGIGSALYERVREEAFQLGSVGLFYECLPDDARLSPVPEVRKQNARRLKFYEAYGARPIWGTKYETPLSPGDDNPPYLVFDGLGRGRGLGREDARRIVRAILERKYGKLCPPAYIEMVVGSIEQDPVGIRPPLYKKVQPAAATPAPTVYPMERIALVVNDRHEIHHVRERGYVESPVRISAILKEITRTDLFERMPASHYGERYITDVHDPRLVSYLKLVCAGLKEGKSVYPYVFPIRNAARPPKDRLMSAGYYCIDTFTPINRNAYLAARGAVDCALTCARKLLDGYRLGYALVRPPGHHAETRAFGGFCYFNSSAIAAHFLSAYGKVAVLDIDYHHGNGTQEIFYSRDDVLTVSIHGHPNLTYPYFSGFEEETGAGPGAGYNLNIPLQENINGARYREHLHRALRRIKRFNARYLVVALGLDTSKGDPTGAWNFVAADFQEVGRSISTLKIPTVVVQEGGYKTNVLGTNARAFFTGLWEGTFRNH